ncbi:MAG TPA: hypothetical protein VGE15_07130 [Sphingobacteriaceae bacterium]
MNEIEEKLWDYIDGVSTPGEKLEIEDRIRRDPAVAVLYRELVSFHAGLAGLEPEHPSMGFTRKVMDAVRQERRPVTVVLDKRLVIGIPAFFGAVFLVFFTVLLYSVNWSQESVQLPVDIAVPPAVYKTVFDGRYLMVFYLADVVLGLYFLDGILRKRLLSNKL